MKLTFHVYILKANKSVRVVGNMHVVWGNVCTVWKPPNIFCMKQLQVIICGTMTGTNLLPFGSGGIMCGSLVVKTLTYQQLFGLLFIISTCRRIINRKYMHIHSIVLWDVAFTPLLKDHGEEVWHHWDSWRKLSCKYYPLTDLN